MENVTNIINTLGFPIACVVACGFFIWKTQQQAREDNRERETKMFEQLDKFGDSLDSFNNTLTKIDARLAAVEKELKIEK